MNGDLRWERSVHTDVRLGYHDFVQFHRAILVVLLTLLVGLFRASIVQANECATVGDNVEFVGRISKETFPSLPNYQSIDDGDAAETYWFLTTDDPICVHGMNFETRKYYELGELKKFQLVLDQRQYEKKRDLLNQRAYVRGKIFSGVSGHHHTKALIDVSDLKGLLTTTGDMVAELSKLDDFGQKAVVMMVRGFIKVVLKRTLVSALESGGDDRVWALKTTAIADGWMMKLSRIVDWADMGDYYETEAMNLAKYIRGETSLDGYLSASRKNQDVLSAIIKPYTNDRLFLSRMAVHKPLADRIGKYIVGLSKFRASE